MWQETCEGKGQQNSEKQKVQAKLLLVGKVFPEMLLKRILRTPYALSQSLCQESNREELLQEKCCHSGSPLRLRYSHTSSVISHFCVARCAGIECGVKTVQSKDQLLSPCMESLNALPLPTERSRSRRKLSPRSAFLPDWGFPR